MRVASAPRLAAALLLVACPAPADGDTSATEGDTSTAAESTTTEADTSTSTTAATDTSGGTTTTGDPPPVHDGEPLPPAEPGTWTWVEFPDARCRSGEPTGLGVRYGADDRLLFYFQGGGACFNDLTCLNNPATADAAEFADWADVWGERGVFNAAHPDNPFADFSVVYVPYCSGDVFAGAREDVDVQSQGLQQFVGHRNVDLFLDRVAPTFQGAAEVVIAGASAGGFGVGFNAIDLARSFPKSQVTILDDSAPILADEYVEPCLQQQWRDVWGLDDTLPAECNACRGADGGGLTNLAGHIGQALPDVHLGLISATRDATISIFYAFGVDNCSGVGVMTGDRYQAGLNQYLTEQLIPSGWATYLIPSTEHVWTQNSAFYDTEVDGVLLTTWVEDLMAGTITHVAP